MINWQLHTSNLVKFAVELLAQPAILNSDELTPYVEELRSYLLEIEDSINEESSEDVGINRPNVTLRLLGSNSPKFTRQYVSTAALTFEVFNRHQAKATLTYELNPEGKFKWLQHWLFSVLDWLGCKTSQPEPMPDKFSINIDDLYGKITSLVPHIAEFYPVNSCALLLGAANFPDLEAHPHMAGISSLQAIAKQRKGMFTSFVRWQMPVFIVPHMRGAVVVPRELLKVLSASTDAKLPMLKS